MISGALLAGHPSFDLGSRRFDSCPESVYAANTPLFLIRCGVHDHRRRFEKGKEMARRIAGAGVVLLNASYEPLAVVPIARAVALVLKERADVIDEVPGRVIRSAAAEIPVPRVIVFRELVRVPYSYREKPWTSRGVLERDGHRCAYCGKSASTVDHVVPKSRGGGNSWLNTVAACTRCNGLKADRTPAEARMPLRFQPRAVTSRESLLVAIAQLGADIDALGLRGVLV